MLSARVRAFAKVNLTLEVLNKRPDGFHNLRTIFQTISLADTLEFDAWRTRKLRVEIDCNVPVAGENIIVRATHAVLRELDLTAAVRCRLTKRIPMGAGLGGGSSDAAAVLLTLPAMWQRTIARERLMEIGASLGSDVPFFLLGGTALGLGRGTELYPLPDLKPLPLLLVGTGVHVSTADAYAMLQRSKQETATAGISPTERLAQALAAGEDWSELPMNDFETAVFTQRPELHEARERLVTLGARTARMTGSGSAIFGVFASSAERDQAAQRWADGYATKARTMRRSAYARYWQHVTMSLSPAGAA